MRRAVNSRIVPLLLVCLTLSLPILDFAYASPGTRVIGCRAMFGVAWSIVAIIGWEDAGTLLQILIDLYRAVGGSRVGRLQDSVSGTGSKEYTFNNIQGGPDEWFTIDVKYYDSTKQDWVHNPDRIGMMECPRPESRTVTQTTTLMSSTTIIQAKTITAEVQMPLSFGQQYWLYLLLVAVLTSLALGYSLTFMTRYAEKNKVGPLCHVPCDCDGPNCNARPPHCDNYLIEKRSPGCAAYRGRCELPRGTHRHQCSHGHKFHQRSW